MKNTKSLCVKQHGVALVITLLLLIVLTILGVASMSGSLMQERMAGNVNLQTLAFEAASSGVSASLEFGFDKANWGVHDSCVRGGGTWDPLPEWGDWSGHLFLADALPDGIVVEYRSRVGCFEPNPLPSQWQDPDYSVPIQLLVLSQGQVRRGDEVLARREIEVRLEDRGGDEACALRIEGSLGDISIKGGGPEVDGGDGGCSVSVTEGVEDLIAEIGNNHIGNYTPPPKEDDGHLPWNDAQEFAKLANELKIAVLAYENYDNSSFSNQEDWRTALTDNTDNSKTAEDLELEQRIKEFVDARNGPWSDPVEGKWDIENCASKFYDGNTRIGDSGNIPGGQCRIEGNSSPSWEHTGVEVGRQPYDPGDPPFITYVAGHLGNPANNSGNGIVIIEGGNCWSGTADFQGLQLILGGHYEIIGGGGGDTSGSIVMTTLEDRYGLESVSFDPKLQDASATPTDTLYPNPEVVEFKQSGLVFNGGGNHKITFECGGGGGKIGLTEYIDRINQCLETAYEPNCDPDGGDRLAIASWREYMDRARWPEN